MDIIALRTKNENGEQTVDSLSLIAGLGIEGDKKAKGGDRQLTLCDEASLIAYRESSAGLCVKRFMPNVTTRGLDYANLSEGDKLTIGKTTIEISSTVKKCFPDCPVVQSGHVCQIKRSCAFAKIIEGGTIKIGDEIVEG